MSPLNSAKDQLIEFLSSFPELDEEKVQVLATMIPVISPKKGTILLEEGQVPKECYFVLKGMVRQYEVIDGNEKSTEFYTEHNGSVSSEHYSEQSPSSFYLECAEDCLLIAGNLEVDEKHMKQFPELMAITKRMMENDLNSTRKNLSNYILLSPKDRYLKLLETRPYLINRLPLHQIASYLGMTAESLSRIRKRIVAPSS